MEIVCSICGISGKMRSVFEVISPKGLILACEKCAFEEGFPILKIPNKRVFEESEKRSRVSEVMARLSGVKPRDQEKPELKRQEKNLREIVNRNYEEKIRSQDLSLKSRPDLVDKFHWIIMRVRRVKGLTQKQLAEMIGESEAAIKMAEQGVVPGGYGLMDKIERSLKVRLIKERNLYSSSGLSNSQTRSDTAELKEKIRPSVAELKGKNQKILSQTQKTLSFDKQSLDSLTIADLQRMKKEREEKRRSDAMLEENRLSVTDLEETHPGVAELEGEAEMWEDEEETRPNIAKLKKGEKEAEDEEE